MLRVNELRCEFTENPPGLDVVQPRLSWKLFVPKRATVQTAYQVRVTEGDAELWNSGKIASDQSVLVAYAGSTLRSGQRCE